MVIAAAATVHDGLATVSWRPGFGSRSDIG
jgi:hypothetical protein